MKKIKTLILAISFAAGCSQAFAKTIVVQKNAQGGTDEIITRDPKETGDIIDNLNHEVAIRQQQNADDQGRIDQRILEIVDLQTQIQNLQNAK